MLLVSLCRATNLFVIRINTAASSEAIFVLQYEQLLFRERSKFEQILNLNPGSFVEDFEVRIRVVDDQGISYTHASDYVSIEQVLENEAIFSYSPLPGDQGDTVYGLARDLVVEYDVKHPSTGAGLFVVNDCHFAQFFSPAGLQPLPVDIVFIIDVSGSMHGRKIKQTQEALETIINQLRPEDRFTMVTFETTVGYWKQQLVPASTFRQQGIVFAQGLQASGGTNFNDGLLAGANILKQDGNPDYVQILVILTDGQPTVGTKTPDAIVENAGNALARTKISLNCLGFGVDLNFDLLLRLALANRGIARRIYEGEDADAQLEGFFETISSPIFQDITIIYEENTVEKVSTTEFPILYNDSEIVIAGQFSCNISQTDTITVQVVGTGASGMMTFESDVYTRDTGGISGIQVDTERLMAYLFIQQLLDNRVIAESQEEIDRIENEVLELSLKYNFVTEFTSLIVIEEGEGSGRENFTLGEGGIGINDRTDEDAFDIAAGCPTCIGVTTAGGGPGVAGVRGGGAALLSNCYLSFLVALGCISLLLSYETT